MTTVIIICLITSVLMMAAVLVKPKITIGKISFGTYWLVTLAGAIVLIASGKIGLAEVGKGLTSDAEINPIKILLLFLSMAVLSIFLDETGFFKFLASVVLTKAKGSQIKLFTAFYITISIVTIFTSNDIIILTFTPFICYFAKSAKVSPIPYLVSEFVAANTCGMLLIIGNPTNIYLATASGVEFIEFLTVMALPTLFAVVTAYAVMLVLFRKTLKLPITADAERAEIKNKPLLFAGGALLLICTVLLVISSYISLQMWLIALLSVAALTVITLIYALASKAAPKELLRAFKRAPWEFVPFVLSMFVLVLALEKSGATERLAEILGAGNSAGTIFKYGFASAIAANLVNNIPMSVLLSSVLGFAGDSTAAMYAVVAGANVAAFLTPIGALAGIMWLQILKDNGIKFSFSRFVLYGVIIAIPTLCAALLGIVIVL